MNQRSPITTTPGTNEATVEALETYAKLSPLNRCAHDAGPVVLASLALGADVATEDLAQRVLQRWLSELPDQLTGVGAFGGLGGFLAGIRAARNVYGGLSSFAEVLVAETPRLLAGVHWRSSGVAWRDYDLFNGPAGLLLAGATSKRPTEPFFPALQHLSLLCDDPGLERLRAGTDIDPRSAFNIGRINTSLGHGVAGVASALRHAVSSFEPGPAHRSALARACSWLAREAFVDARGLITWPPVGQEGIGAPVGVNRRQAWCYGTPGVAWTLWHAGRALGDWSLQHLGEEAMRSFCQLFEAELYLDTDDIGAALSICHGAAGTLAVADAFARHADLGEAASLRDYLDHYLAARVADIAEHARRDMTMLTGSGGILSVVLTAHGGGREWLSQIALC